MLWTRTRGREFFANLGPGFGAGGWLGRMVKRRELREERGTQEVQR